MFMRSVTAFASLPPLGRFLWTTAGFLPASLGGKSVLRKFIRRCRGTKFQARVIRGFDFSGEIGDSVDNRIATDLDFEPALSDFIAGTAGEFETFLDIGCNVGWFSCLVGALPGSPKTIVSVDANPSMVRACEANMALNGFRTIGLVRALGPENGTITFYIPERRHSRASIGKPNTEKFGDTKAIEVEMVPLGDVLQRFPGGRCDLIKMDIEGYELEVLRTVPTATILQVGRIVLEYTRSNLEGCGFGGMTLGVLPWLEHFTVESLSEDGVIRKVADPAGYSPHETTFILTNRSRPI